MTDLGSIEPVGIAPAGGVVGVEPYVKGLVDLVFRIQAQLVECVSGAARAQFELVFAQIGRMETIAGACLDPFPHVVGVLLGPLHKEIVRPHVAAVDVSRRRIPIKGAAGIALGMTVVHLVLENHHLVFQPPLRGSEQVAIQRPQGVVYSPGFKQIDECVGLAQVSDRSIAAADVNSVFDNGVTIMRRIFLHSVMPAGRFALLPYRQQSVVHVCGHRDYVFFCTRHGYH